MGAGTSPDAIFDLTDFVIGLDVESLSPAVTVFASEHVTDTIGVMIGGSASVGISLLADEVVSWCGHPEATIVLSGLRSTAQNAALVNTAMARALDYDDVHMAPVHASVGVVPVALTVADMIGSVGGSDLLASVIAGCEVSTRLATAASIPVQESGMSHTYQSGLFGATAASAKLMGLSREQLLNAFGIAYGMVSGNQQVYLKPAMSVRVQQGLTASNAVVACRLAARGITSVHEVLEGPLGYFSVYQGNQYDRGRLLDDLGDRFEYLNTLIKPYPACGQLHSVIEAGAQLRDELGCEPTEVDHVQIALTPGSLGHPGPGERWTLSGPPRQFSIASSFALGFVRATPGIDDYALDSPVGVDDLRHVAEKVEVDYDPALHDRFGRRIGPVMARVHLIDGRQAEITLEASDPDRATGEGNLRHKFVDCCGHASRAIDDPDALYDQLMDLLNVDDCRSLVRTHLA